MFRENNMNRTWGKLSTRLSGDLILDTRPHDPVEGVSVFWVVVVVIVWKKLLRKLFGGF